MVLYKQSKVSERNLKVFLSQILHKSSTFVSKEKGQISMKAKIQAFLRRFSFRTGVIVLVLCVPCYIISFAQMALPICVELKGACEISHALLRPNRSHYLLIYIASA